MARYSYLVISSPVPGREAEYDAWYTERHLPDVLAVPGFVAAQRFAVAEPENPLPGSHVAIYEMETADPAGVLATLQAIAGGERMPMSPAIDLARVQTVLLGAITPRLMAIGGGACAERGRAIVTDMALSFDAGDPKNGSLYLCREPGATGDAAIEAAVRRLRAAGLWSDATPTAVAPAQKEAYAAQLAFVGEATACIDGARVLLARYDHPRFPSDGGRFAAWCRCLGAF